MLLSFPTPRAALGKLYRPVPLSSSVTDRFWSPEEGQPAFQLPHTSLSTEAITIYHTFHCGLPMDSELCTARPS